MIFCHTLGPPAVLLDDGTAPANLQWHKNMALLVYLARSPKRARARDHLLALFWGDKPEEDARHSLNQAVSTLRTHAKDGIDTDRTRVRLTDGAVALDVEQMEAFAARGALEDAARLITGEFLEGFSIAAASGFEDWLLAERAHWQRRSVEVLAGLSAQALERGDVAAAEDAARRAAQLDEHSDVALRARLRALVLAEERERALTEFAAFAARLKRDLGAEPNAETQALVDHIRRSRGRLLHKKVTTAADAESRRAPLVGRSAELERLGAAWAASREGRLSVAIVCGDGGTGKTRLAEELADRARLDGGVVAAVRAVQADQRDAWSGVLGIARAGLLDAPGIAGVAPAALAQLRGSTPSEALARAFVEGLRAVAEEQPVLVVVDDAHWLDRESLLALGAAGRDLARSRVLLLCTTSPAESRDELDALRAHIGRELGGVALTLAPLGNDAVRALARWAAPTFDEVQLERLTRRVMVDSAGIPLLAVELLNAVAAGLDLREVRGAWPEPLRTLQQTLPGGLPDAITAAIRVNFHRLSSDARSVLVAAAVLDGRVPAAVLGRAAGVAGEALDTALDELEWQRWLTAEPRGYTFVARIVRDVVDRDMVVPGQRRRMLEAGRDTP
jgi:DNA-binding SARP family transcriptional activator